MFIPGMIPGLGGLPQAKSKDLSQVRVGHWIQVLVEEKTQRYQVIQRRDLPARRLTILTLQFGAQTAFDYWFGADADVMVEGK